MYVYLKKNVCQICVENNKNKEIQTKRKKEENFAIFGKYLTSYYIK